jgi:hypothetical protein
MKEFFSQLSHSLRQRDENRLPRCTKSAIPLAREIPRPLEASSVIISTQAIRSLFLRKASAHRYSRATRSSRPRSWYFGTDRRSIGLIPVTNSEMIQIPSGMAISTRGAI